MLGSRWAQKPPVGTPLDGSSGLAGGLLGFWPCNEGSGGSAADAGPYGLTAGSTSPAWGVGPGPGVASLFLASVPPWLAISYPFVLAAGVRLTGTPGDLIGYGTSAGGMGHVDATATTWQGGADHGGFDWGVPTAPYLDRDLVMAGEFGNGVVRLWIGGQLIASTGSVAGTNPFPTSNGLIQLVGSPAAIIDWVGFWGRSLTAAEHECLAANPWQIFRPRGDLLRYAAPSGSRISYARGSSTCRPVHLPTADLSCYLD